MRFVVLLSCLVTGCAEPVVRTLDGVAPRDELSALSQACIDRPTPTNRAALADLAEAYPESPDIHMMRGGCELGAANLDSADQGEALSLAHASYTRSIALVDAGRPASNPLPEMLTMRYIVRSIQAIEAGEPYYWAPALEDMDRAIDLEPTAIRHADRATVHAQHGDAQLMMADLDQAQTLAGSNAEARAHIESVREVEAVRALLAVAER